MKLKKRVALVLMCMCVSIPTFAFELSDTYSFDNITNTIATNGTNRYIIASDNTIKANGTGVVGSSVASANTGDRWVQVVKGLSGVATDSIVNMCYVKDLCMIDSNGDLHIVGAIDKMILNPFEGVKFKDVGQYYIYVSTLTSSTDRYTIAISDDGDAYWCKSDILTKIPYATDIKKVVSTKPYLAEKFITTNLNILLKNDGKIYTLGRDQKLTSPNNISEVMDVYEGENCVYLKFTSGKVSKLAYNNSVTEVIIPEGEEVIHIFGDSNLNLGLITNKHTYKLTDGVITEYDCIDTDDNSHVSIVSMSGELALGDNGKYYSCKVENNTFKLTKIVGIEKWANDNPIVRKSELANFQIPLNEIFKRQDSYAITYSLVTKDVPKAFNLYYAKTVGVTDKMAWKLIEGNVGVDRLSPKLYETGYVDSKGNAINGKTYTYNWTIGDEDLVGVHLIVEPIYE